MKRMNPSICRFASLLGAGLLAMSVAGCGSTPATTEPPKPGNGVAALPTIRIKAGLDAPFKDSKGILWAADNGSDGGQTVNREGEITITGTDRPELYTAEHYFDAETGAYHLKVPNGSYVVALHFSEDYDGITQPGDRKFTYAVKNGGDSGKI
ncbi:MAG TPA: malectin domain-containing carbohydrate-binding protein, partial [Phycisphaerae bacterium]|nr:malectin domain-containing carbohydrate-binding protein [Phycisphaerae bacterium]